MCLRLLATKHLADRLKAVQRICCFARSENTDALSEHIANKTNGQFL